ncbi:helix-turn-helix domain-containing protein [Leptolyngbya ohadii]|uniref:helix-turn-helix domain-containing protein n=1 Tax=Leptolyngbya ohadii TaxID=1962290 RepID=UPI000B599EF6|nr:helix-turn-helix domain-containing protein [Leptolyngbya ohadii]
MLRQYGEYPLCSEYSAEQSKFLTPFQRRLLLQDLQSESRPEYRRRIEIILLADVGKSQSRICAMLGCSQETARYWIAITQAGQPHLWNQAPVGRPKTVNDQYLDRLRELASHSPRDYGYPFQNWTAHWLSKHLAKELGIEISDRHVNRLLKNMGLSSQHHRTISQTADDSKNPRIVIENLQSGSSLEQHS